MEMMTVILVNILTRSLLSLITRLTPSPCRTPEGPGSTRDTRGRVRETRNVRRKHGDREVGCYAHSFSPFITQPPVPSALSLRHRLMNRRNRKVTNGEWKRRKDRRLSDNPRNLR